MSIEEKEEEKKEEDKEKEIKKLNLFLYHSLWVMLIHK